MTETTTRTAPKAKRRVPFWDNAKWLTMALVVVGHAMQPVAAESDLALVPYLVLYAFHMPFFGVISGYFTTETPGVKQYGRVVGDLLVPYIVFETIWSVIQSAVAGSWSYNPVTPSWTLWFLLALAGFRIALPVLARLRWPLVWTAALAIAIGYFPDVDQTFSAMRAIQMLPFFVLGWQLRQGGLVTRWLDATRTLWIRVAAVGAFVVVGVVVGVDPAWWRDVQIREWLLLDGAYTRIGDGEVAWYDAGIKLALMLVAVLLIAAAFVLVPRRRTWFTAWGAATMYIYLLHTFVLYAPRETGWLRAQADEWWSLPAAIVCGVGIAILLSTGPVRTATRWIVEPSVGWLLRRDRDRERDPATRPTPTAQPQPQPQPNVTDGDVSR